MADDDPFRMRGGRRGEIRRPESGGGAGDERPGRGRGVDLGEQVLFEVEALRPGLLDEGRPGDRVGEGRRESQDTSGGRVRLSPGAQPVGDREVLRDLVAQSLFSPLGGVPGGDVMAGGEEGRGPCRTDDAGADHCRSHASTSCACAWAWACAAA